MRVLLLTIGILCIFTHSWARESRLKFRFAQALSHSEVRSKLGNDIQFFFGEDTSPTYLKDWGVVVSPKEANAFNKSDERACENAFLSALLSLRDQARKRNANAVTEISSFYQNKPSSPDQYECSAGALIAAVTLRGRLVNVETK